MITIEEEIIKIFFETDNKLREKGNEESINSRFSNSEVITLSIAKELIGKGTDKDFYRLIIRVVVCLKHPIYVSEYFIL